MDLLGLNLNEQLDKKKEVEKKPSNSDDLLEFLHVGAMASIDNSASTSNPQETVFDPLTMTDNNAKEREKQSSATNVLSSVGFNGNGNRNSGMDENVNANAELHKKGEASMIENINANSGYLGVSGKIEPVFAKSSDQLLSQNEKGKGNDDGLFATLDDPFSSLENGNTQTVTSQEELLPQSVEQKSKQNTSSLTGGILSGAKNVFWRWRILLDSGFFFCLD